ncbi:MAG: DUF2191 domain-containing protein [Gammaproteobacteria bacterium]|nr:DUF2191 domain-containing protein [Gammaproteobacteria bacterium]MYF29649.1 DUF2191 domain-containing protein [Gammaproteobacteria bacterium]MYK44791.1 DUF2191 domain-containing protein [Gammaproteobacteria bacterium]
MLKTTIEIADDLAREAKAHAGREGTTLRSLIERGLRLAMRADRRSQRFTLRDASVTGRGMQPGYRDAGWSRIREAAYEDRGG